MNVHEVVEITRGVLKSHPFVHSFSHITQKASQVKKGSLFVALEPSNIDLALSLGAYGILYDQEVQISDAEIAWICVDHLPDAIDKLLYYKLLGAKIEAVCVSEVEFAILSKIVSSTFLLFFEGQKVDLLDLDLRAVTHIVVQDVNLVCFFYHEFSISQAPMPFSILLSGLFSVSICYQGRRYDLKLSSFYTQELSRALQICALLGVVVDLDRLGSIAPMQPFYTNSQLELCAFGQSSQILVLEKEQAQVLKMVAYAQKIAPWQRIQIFTPMPLEVPHILYSDLHTLQQALLDSDYSLAFIVGELDIHALLKPKKSPGSLFSGV